MNSLSRKSKTQTRQKPQRLESQGAEAASRLIASCPEAIRQRKQQAMVHLSPQVQRLTQLQSKVNGGPCVEALGQLQAVIDYSQRQVVQRMSVERLFGCSIQSREGSEKERLDFLSSLVEPGAREAAWSPDRTQASQHPHDQKMPTSRPAIPTAAAAQLKPLSTEFLNLVSENHDESNLPGRREIEARIANKEANGEYWGESDFKVRDLGFSESVAGFFGKKVDQRAAADPLVLRANHMCVHASQGCERLLRWYASKDGAEFDETASNKDDLLEALKGSGNNILGSFLSLIRFGEISEKSEEWQLMSAEEKSALSTVIELAEQMRDVVIAFLRRINKCNLLAAIHAELAENEELITRVKETMDQQGPILVQSARAKWSNEFEAEDSQRQLTGTGPSRFLRSMEMDSAANARSKTKGIWKVGFSHFVDISNQQSDRAYTMLSREEFNDEYADKYKLPLLRG